MISPLRAVDHYGTEENVLKETKEKSQAFRGVVSGTFTRADILAAREEERKKAAERKALEARVFMTSKQRREADLKEAYREFREKGEVIDSALPQNDVGPLPPRFTPNDFIVDPYTSCKRIVGQAVAIVLAGIGTIGVLKFANDDKVPPFSEIQLKGEQSFPQGTEKPSFDNALVCDGTTNEWVTAKGMICDIPEEIARVCK